MSVVLCFFRCPSRLASLVEPARHWLGSLMLKNGAPRGKPLSDFQKALLVQKSTSRLDTKMGEEN